MTDFVSKLRGLIGGARPAVKARRADEGAAIEGVLFRDGWRPFAVRDGDTLSILVASDRASATPLLVSGSRPALLQAFERGEFSRVIVRKLRPSGPGGGLGRPIDATRLLDWFRAQPDRAFDLIYRFPIQSPIPPAHGMVTRSLQLQREPDLAAFAPGALARHDAVGVQATAATPQDWRDVEALMARFDDVVLWPHVKDGVIGVLPVPAALSADLQQLSPSQEDIKDAIAAGALLDLLDPALCAPRAPLFSGAEQAAFLACLAAEPRRLMDALGPRLVTRRPAEDPVRLHAPRGDAEVLRRHAVMLAGSRAPWLVPILKVIGGKDADPLSARYNVEPLWRVEPVVRRRSVVFLNQCYYNFTHLSKALRARGWDAVSLSLIDPASATAQLFHGVDVSLFDADHAVFVRNLRQFYESAVGRFGIVHGYGKGAFSFFQDHYDTTADYDRIPWDLLDMKARGVLLGYSHSGCLDMVSQTTFGGWSPNACPRCVWRDRQDICSDARNLAWGWKMRALTDLICLETEPGFDFKGSEQAFRDPLTFALDPETWRTDLTPPAHLVRDREPGEVVVFHAVGNYRSRTQDGVNIKGTHAVIEAIDRLRAEGLSVRLDFVHDVPSIDMRYVQAQADIIIDQLNYGRYGAAAREGMMLGKPVVGRVNKIEPDGRRASECIMETAIVHADEETVYEVLKTLVLDADLRARLGQESRAHALKWWSAPVLAERFEQVYDALRDGQVPARLA